MTYNFQQTTIGEICNVVTDGSHYSPKSVTRGEYMVSVKDFTPFGFDFSGCRQISKSDYNDLVRAGCVPEKDDILIGKDGARFFEDIVIYRQPQKPALLSSIAILRANKTMVEPEYLYYMLKSPLFKKDVRENYGSGSAIPRIILKDFRRMPVEIPPLPVQKHVAAILSALDSRIANNSKINHHLEQMAQAIFQSWFVDFEPSKPFTEVVQVLGGGTPKTGTAEFWNGSIPFFTPKDAQNTYVLSTEKSLSEAGLSKCNSRLYPENTVFVTARGTVGKLALAGCPMAMNQSCYALLGNDGYGQYFVYHLTQNVLESLKHKASGAVFDAIVTRDFESEIVPTPTTEEVRSFEEKVAPFYEAILNNSNENARLTALRDILLPRLMSGELSVADLNDAK